jgi:hypothetical protein
MKTKEHQFLNPLAPSSLKLGESTDFKGSKSVSITRFSGGDKGMMIQLTDKKRGNITMPVQEASILGRALQDKKLMKV